MEQPTTFVEQLKRNPAERGFFTTMQVDQLERMGDDAFFEGRDKIAPELVAHKGEPHEPDWREVEANGNVTAKHYWLQGFERAENQHRSLQKMASDMVDDFAQLRDMKGTRKKIKSRVRWLREKLEAFEQAVDRA